MNTQEDVLRTEGKVLELRAQGLTVEQIAEHPDVTIRTSSGVSKAIRRALERQSDRGLREYQGLALAQLDSIDAATAHLLTQPGVTPADVLRALDLRRKTIESRGKILGHLGRAAELSAKAAQDAIEAAAPELGNGTVLGLRLDDVPRGLLPPLELARTIGDDELFITFTLDMHGPRLVRRFAEEGTLRLGNGLMRADPERCGPLIEYLVGEDGTTEGRSDAATSGTAPSPAARR